MKMIQTGVMKMNNIGLFGGNKVGYRHNMLDDGECRRIKVKVVEKPEIVVHGTVDKPYYSIKYKVVGDDDYTIGYSSYNLKICLILLNEEFEIVSENGENKNE